MTGVKIDGKEYDLESLSEEARAELLSLRYVDQQIEELNRRLAVYQTARNAYLRGLLEKLPQPVDAPAARKSPSGNL